MHREGDGGFHCAEVHVDAAIVIGHIRRTHLPVRLRTAVHGQVFLGDLIRLPDGGPAGRLRRHHINAVAVFNRQFGDTGTHKFHDLVLDIAVGIHRAADGQGHVLRSDARAGLPVQIDQHNSGAGKIIAAAHQLLGQFTAAFPDAQGSQRTITRMGIGSENHASAAGHHLPVERMNDRHIRGNIHAAVFVRRGERKHMVILINRPAHGTEAVVTVGQHVGHGKFPHAGCPGRLDDAHVGDVMAGQGIKAHFEMLHVPAPVMCSQNRVRNGSL